MRKIFFVGLAMTGIGAYLYYRRQVDLLYAMSYSIAGVEMLERNPDLWKAKITMNVKNCSEIPFTLTGWNFDILVNNEQVSKITDNKQKVSVGANGGVTPLSFIVEFNPKNYGLLDILATLIDTGKGTQITIQGNVSVYSGLFITTKSPVDFTYTFEDFIGSDNDGSQISC